MKREKQGKGHVRPLLIGHLERIGSIAFSDFRKQITKLVQYKHGVYALYKGDRLYYVGLATNLRTRIPAHLKDKHAGKWNRFSLYLVRKVEHITEIESIILRTASPEGNTSKGRLPGSKDLWRDLRETVRTIQKKQMRELHDDGRNFAKSPQRRKKTEAKEPRQPVLAKYKGNPRTLRAYYKGKKLTARVWHDGSIRFHGKVFNSPSLASIAAVRQKRNGWMFWSYERVPGQWARLDTLRK